MLTVSRFYAVVLIPCLLTDPLLASSSAVCHLAIFPLTTIGVQSRLNQEALGVVALNFRGTGLQSLTAQEVMRECADLKVGDAAAADQHALTPSFQFAGVQHK